MATTNNDRTGATATPGMDAADASMVHADAIETTIDRGVATDFGASPDDEAPNAMAPADAGARAGKEADAEADAADGGDKTHKTDYASDAADAGSADHAEEDDDDDESEDSLTYSNGVIEKIVALATREAKHVLGMKGNLWHSLQEQFGAQNLTKGVTVEVTDDNRVIVNISVIIEYGSYAPAIFEDVKERVTERLGAMTGLEVAGINLRIEDVVTREEYEASSKHLIDSLKPGNDDEDEETEE